MGEHALPAGADSAATDRPLRAPIAPFLLDMVVAEYPTVVVQRCDLAPADDPVSGVVSDHLVQINFSHAVPVTCQVDGRRHTGIGYPGDIVVLPSDLPAAYTWAQPSTLLQLYLAPRLVASVADDVVKADGSLQQLRPRFLIRDPLIEQLGLAFLNELQSQTMGGSLYAESLALTLTLHLLRTHAAHSSAPTSVAQRTVHHPLHRAVEYIHAHLDQPIPLVHLAASVDLSPYHFARVFKQRFGLAPHHYVIERRVERAKHLLEEGTLSVAEVAHRVGFADQSHLARHFKQRFGISPKALINQSKNIGLTQLTIRRLYGGAIRMNYYYM